MIRLLFLFAFIMLLDVGSFFTWPSASKKRNCKWSEWQGAKCIKIGVKSLRIRQTRVKFPAKNGGKDCTGPSSRYISCNEVQYTAQGLFDAVATASPAGRSSQPGFRTSIDAMVLRQPTILAYNPCATPFYGASGTLRMGGKCVKVRRRRRRADGYIEIVEEPAPAQFSSNTRVKREILSTANRDILFLIDESGSIKEKNFKKEIRLAKTLTSKFCGNIDVGKKKTRVAIMTFNQKQTPHLNFDKYFDKPSIVKTMDKIKYKGGGTCIVDALEFVRKDMITPARGARNFEPGTERLVVFMTDG
ncbi:uncharacterized protein LOC144425714 [Styela clava]